MATGFITVKDPTSVIPLVTFSPRLEGYSRKLVQRSSVRGFTQGGIGVILGRSGEQRYEWDISGLVGLDDLERFDAIAIAGDDLYGDGQDGYRTLEDEIRYVFPHVAPHPKTLIASIATGYGMVKGFGRFKVAIALNDDHGAYQGRQQGQDAYLISFTAVELPE